MKRRALYFGTFNPLHIGHVTILKYLTTCGSFDEVAIVVSPQSPFKEGLTESATQRLNNVREDLQRLNLDVKVMDIEFYLPPPYYTINTLKEIDMQDTDYQNVLIIGGDNVLGLEKWHNASEILNNYEIWVYPRDGYEISDEIKRLGLHLIDAPMINISSTEIREKKMPRGI